MASTTSRRELMRLGTAAAAYVAGAAIVTGSPAAASASNGPRFIDRCAWDEAFAHVQRERARDAEINRRFERAQADGTLTDAFEQEWSDSVEPLCDAEWALFDTPAPDLKALDWKMTMLSERGLVFEGDIAATILADVKRLSGGEA